MFRLSVKKAASKLVALLIFTAIFTYSVDIIFHEFEYFPGYIFFKVDSFPVFLVFTAVALTVGLLLPLGNSLGSAVVWVVYLMHVFGSIALGGLYTCIYSSCALTNRLLLVFVFAILYVGIGLLAAKVKLRIPMLRASRRLLAIFIVIFSFFASSFLVYKLGLPLHLPGYSEIYLRRQIFKETILSHSGALFPYISLSLTYAVFPFILAMAVYLFACTKQRATAVLLAGAVIPAIFSIFNAAAYKSTVAVALVSIILALLASTRWRMSPNNISMLVLWLINFSGMLALLLHALNSSSPWLIHFFRRVFVVPGMHTWFYFDSFGLFSSQFIRDAPTLISGKIYGAIGSANAGLIGSGFAVLGITGVFINLCLFAMWIVLANAVSGRTPLAIKLPLSLVLGYLFSNSATTTVFLTYGGVLVLIFLYVFSGLWSWTFTGDYPVSGSNRGTYAK